MSTSRPEPPASLPPAVGLGDLLWAVRALRPEPATIDAMVELLGLRTVRAQAEPVGRRTAAPRPDTRDDAVSTARARTPLVPPGEGAAVPAGASGVPMVAIPYRGSIASSQPSGSSIDELLPKGPAPPRPEPLFRPRSKRALFRALGAVRQPVGEVDVEAVVDALASRRPLRRLPRRCVPHTAGRLQVLIDTGPSMEPFRRDIDAFPLELRHVLGADGVELRWFQECPMLDPGAFRENRFEAEAYVLPDPDVRILAVTCFGIRGTRGADPEVRRGWAKLLRRAAEAGIGVVVLTPLPAQRVGPLGRGARVVAWDRGTGVRSVAHAVDRTLGRTPGA